MNLPSLLHALKPDGHGNNPLATELHRLACQLQEQSDQCHAAITTVTDPKFKGDVVGELVPWPGHFPLELDHTGDFLNDIMVRGVSVSEHLMGSLWDEALDYLKERFSPEQTPSQARNIAHMDKRDLRDERAA